MKYLNVRNWITEYHREISDLDELKALLLARQGITPEVESTFFYPTVDHLNNPFLLKDMELAVEVILGVYSRNGKVLIYGDYDADGVSSTSLLLRFFRQIGLEADYLLPSRLGSGYGLHDEAVEKIIDARPDLVITVDNGSSSSEQIASLMKEGIPVIITDHHQVPEEEPVALAFINPHRIGDAYPFKGLAGVGVALQLVRGVYFALGLSGSLGYAFTLAALGTIADSMPLTEDNRVIVSLGLKQLDEAPLGLQFLIKELKPEGTITAEFFAFSVASRLNAAGRMDDLEPAMTLLLTDDEAEALAAIHHLENLNDARRTLESKIQAEAEAQLTSQSLEDKENIIILADENWHPGVIGIISARISEKYGKPSLCFAGVAGELRGSARSVGEFDILEALQSAEEHTVTLGGHKQAAGVTVHPEDYEAFAQKVRAYCATQVDSFPAEESEQAFVTLEHELLSEDLLEFLNRFEPFGNAHEKPKFIFRNLKVHSLRNVGDGSHLSTIFRTNDGREIRGIAFRMGDFVNLFRAGDTLDVLAEVSENTWNGRTQIQIQIYDMRPGEENLNLFGLAIQAGQAWLTGKSIVELEANPEYKSLGLALNPTVVGNFWLYLEGLLREKMVIKLHPALLAQSFSRKAEVEFSPFACARIIEILAEAGLIRLDKKNPEHFKLSWQEPIERPRLSEQKTWQRLASEGGIR